ncbi:MAG: FAD-dependent monooxygenase, partial [Betaproteobacteria bacterium]|nr:FAD-dependent monooxygenase [Betaproteobacteria bacterium]
MAEPIAAPANAARGAGMRIAVVGAGPVGLSLALQLRQLGSAAQLHVFDAQPRADAALADPRVLALSEGSRQCLHALGAWPRDAATAIRRIHVSQHAEGLASLPRVMLQAEEAGLPALGYTVRYGELLAALQGAARAAGIDVHYGQAVQAQQGAVGARLVGVGVGAPEGLAVDVAVLAEGGAFHNQEQRELHHDYEQTALIGQVRCEHPHDGLAIERFTEHGPVALLPRGADFALVWCVPPHQAQAV